jgi:hypothetical protein
VHDEAPSWDLPAQRRAAGDLGLPVVALTRQPHRSTPDDLAEVLRTAPAGAAGRGAA